MFQLIDKKKNQQIIVETLSRGKAAQKYDNFNWDSINNI